SIVVVCFRCHGCSTSCAVTDEGHIFHILSRFVEAPAECDIRWISVHLAEDLDLFVTGRPVENFLSWDTHWR
ncbi:hypothetical protein X975_25658, partial [Stegodyphus mimosarum]